MTKSSVKVLDNYWRNFFSEQRLDLNFKNYIKDMPPKVQEYFDVDYLPEPFYGYLAENMKEDIVLLLLNPGEVDVKTQQKYFNSTDSDRLIKLANDYVYDRHVNWRKEDYIRHEQFDYPGRAWRRQKLSQCEKIVGHSIPFLHTIELFPFHSKNWNMKKSIKEDWLYNLESTRLFVEAIEEMSKYRLSKYIFGIGKDWVEILNRFPTKFQLVDTEVILGPKSGRAHSIYQFKLVNDADSLPIIIYSGVSMNLPVNDERAVQVFRSYLKIQGLFV